MSVVIGPYRTLGAVLACVGFTVFQWYTTDTFTRVLNTYGLYFIAMAASIIPTFVITYRRTTHGIAAAALIIALFFSYGVSKSHPEGRSRRQNADKTGYTFRINQHPGAGIRVNGVYLGKSPVDISPQEFDQKVPAWKQPPVGIKNRISVRNHDYRSIGSWSGTELAQWSPPSR